MLTFLKAQLAAIAGSAVDFLIYALMVQLTGNSPAMVSLATAEGAVSGGVINFLIARKWVFNEGQHKKRVQVARYILVWVGSILLNSLGMYLFTYFTTLNYMLARILVSVLVGVLYNYFLQKRFVFK